MLDFDEDFELDLDDDLLYFLAEGTLGRTKFSLSETSLGARKTGEDALMNERG